MSMTVLMVLMVPIVLMSMTVLMVPIVLMSMTVLMVLLVLMVPTVLMVSCCWLLAASSQQLATGS